MKKSKKSKLTLNKNGSASQSMHNNGQPHPHDESGAPATAPLENGAAAEQEVETTPTAEPGEQTRSCKTAREERKTLDELAKAQGWNHRDLGDAIYIHENFANVMVDGELFEWIRNVYPYEDHGKWDLKSVFETYAIIRGLSASIPAWRLTKEQKRELIIVLWESRCNTPEEGPDIKLETLRDSRDLVFQAQVIFDELISWKFSTAS